jgi:hypothetical protein
MEKHDYLKEMTNDVIDYVKENFDAKEIAQRLADDETRAEFEEQLHDDLWTEDSVTGNASGSYTFSTWDAEENLCHNLDLLEEALTEFGYNYFLLEKGAEWADVTIRCYLLQQAIREALDVLDDGLSGEK